MDYFGGFCCLVPLALLTLASLMPLVGSYNKLVALRENVEASWSQISVQLTRRHDLIPNLISIAKRYRIAESKAMERIVQARYAALGATDVPDRARAEDVLHQMATKLLAVMEAYPNLQADQHYLSVQSNWSEAEGSIASSRSTYNDAVREYNSYLSQFPHALVGAMFLLPRANYFEPQRHSEKAAIHGTPSS